LLRANQTESALQHLETAVKLQPSLVVARVQLGTVRAVQGKRQEAIGHFRAALRHVGTNPRRAANLLAIIRHLEHVSDEELE
jgi:cytochrome c-type biogenesis protein CcmH/NrfG